MSAPGPPRGEDRSTKAFELGCESESTADGTENKSCRTEGDNISAVYLLDSQPIRTFFPSTLLRANLHGSNSTQLPARQRLHGSRPAFPTRKSRTSSYALQFFSPHPSQSGHSFTIQHSPRNNHRLQVIRIRIPRLHCDVSPCAVPRRICPRRMQSKMAEVTTRARRESMNMMR